MTVFIASSDRYLEKIAEDKYIRDACIGSGFDARIATLSSITTLAKAGDVVVLKSIWGFHKDRKTFLEQLELLQSNGVFLVNDYHYIYWNLDKVEYLSEIASQLPTIPTIPLALGPERTDAQISSAIDLARSSLAVDELVIKPRISESGYLTYYQRKGLPEEKLIIGLQQNKDFNFLAQPFRSSFIDGELSVIALNGSCLYGIRRFPGVFAEKSEPMYVPLGDIPEALVESIASLFTYFQQRVTFLPAICRIDFLEVGTEYEVLEVELIDPDLFLRHVPEDIRHTTLTIISQFFYEYV